MECGAYACVLVFSYKEKVHRIFIHLYSLYKDSIEYLFIFILCTKTKTAHKAGELLTHTHTQNLMNKE